jgi:hypothetical protein
MVKVRGHVETELPPSRGAFANRSDRSRAKPESSCRLPAIFPPFRDAPANEP